MSKFHDHSFPYLTGNSFAVQCKYIWNYNGFEVNPHKDNNWVFIKTDYVKDFFSSRHVPNHPFVVFTHNSDHPLDEKYKQYIEHPKVVKWFSQNVDYTHEKLIPIPIGIANSNYLHGNIATIDKIRNEHNEHNKSQLFYANYSLCNGRERQYCLEQTGIPLTQPENGGWTGFQGGYVLPKTLEEYLRDVSKSYFVLSPRGIGIDCHRTWEALYVSSIPIVIANAVAKEHSDFPIVILNDWSEFKSINFSEEMYRKVWSNYNPGAIHMDNYLRRLKEKYSI